MLLSSLLHIVNNVRTIFEKGGVVVYMPDLKQKGIEI